MENMFRNLQRLTLVHETGLEGHPDTFRFQPRKEGGGTDVELKKGTEQAS